MTDLAGAILRSGQRQTERARNVMRGEVVSTNPLRFTLLYADELIDDADLTSWAEFYSREFGVQIGDTALLQREGAQWVCIDFIGDVDVDLTNATFGTGPQLNERIRDVVADFVKPGTNVTVVHNDPANTLTIAATGGGGGGGTGTPDAHMEFEFVAASTSPQVITRTHNLGKKPTVSVEVLLGGIWTEVGVEVQRTDTTVTVTSDTLFSGRIVLN